jgi:hypothetical protein
MTFRENLMDHISAGFSGLWIKTADNESTLAEIAAVVSQNEWNLAVWDASNGLQEYEVAGGKSNTNIADPGVAVKHILTLPNRAGREPITSLLVLKHFHHLIGKTLSLLQAVELTLQQGRKMQAYVIVLSPVVQIPLELEKQFVVLEHPLPNREELWKIATNLATGPGELPEDEETKARLLDSAAGLTNLETEGAFSLSIIRHQKLAPEEVWELKSQALKKSGNLELHRGPERFEDLGGLDPVKTFCVRALQRRDNPLLRPKGILLLGLPGCLHADTPILDPTDGTTSTVRDRYLKGVPFHVCARDDNGKPVVTEAWPPQVYPPSPMVKLTFDTGASITVTPGHRIFSEHDYELSSRLVEKLQSDGVCRLATISERDLLTRVASAQRSTQTLAGDGKKLPGRSSLQVSYGHSGYTQEHNETTRIVKVEYLPAQPYYDFHVPGYNNYWACDTWHHNTGKSAFAKALGNETGRPTVTLNLGNLLGSLVGQTEQQTRLALQIVDAMAPCVLFVDEIEKGLAGTGEGSHDSGVGSRMLGSLLGWLNDHESDVFFIGTANDLRAIPPAFTRAERFDGIFFLDLPGRQAKDAIWEMYLKKFALPLNMERPNDEQWTGAEIRSCCRLAAMLDIDLEDAALQVVPVAVTSAESIASLRGWAENRCLSADFPGVYQSKLYEKLIQNPGPRRLQRR